MKVDYSDEFKQRVANLKPGSMNVLIALREGELRGVEDYLTDIAEGNPALFIEMLDAGDFDELRDYLLSMEEARELLDVLDDLVEDADLKEKYVVAYTN